MRAFHDQSEPVCDWTAPGMQRRTRTLRIAVVAVTAFLGSTPVPLANANDSSKAETSAEADADEDVEAMARGLGLSVPAVRRRLSIEADLDRISAEIAKELKAREISCELDWDREKLVFTVTSKADVEIVLRHGQIARLMDLETVARLRAAELKLNHAAELLAQSGRPSGLSSWAIDWNQGALRVNLYVGTPEARQAADAMRSQILALGVPVQIEETRALNVPLGELYRPSSAP